MKAVKFQLQTQTVHTSFTLAQLLDHRQNRYKTDMLQYFRANYGNKDREQYGIKP